MRPPEAADFAGRPGKYAAFASHPSRRALRALLRVRAVPFFLVPRSGAKHRVSKDGSVAPSAAKESLKTRDGKAFGHIGRISEVADRRDPSVRPVEQHHIADGARPIRRTADHERRWAFRQGAQRPPTGQPATAPRIMPDDLAARQ